MLHPEGNHEFREGAEGFRDNGTLVYPCNRLQHPYSAVPPGNPVCQKKDSGYRWPIFRDDFLNKDSFTQGEPDCTVFRDRCVWVKINRPSEGRG